MLAAATHGLLVGLAPQRLQPLPLRRFLLTDSLPAPAVPSLSPETCSIASLLAGAIRRLHQDEPLDELALLA